MITLGGGRRAIRSAAEKANGLERAGRPLEAIDLLVETIRSHPDPGLQRQLVQVRNRAFGELGQDPSPPAAPDPGGLGEEDGLPAVAATELTAGRIRAAIEAKGSLIVRGLVDPSDAARLREGIDRVFEARGRAAHGESSEDTAPDYDPFVPDDRYGNAVELGRSFVNEGSGVWTADSPKMLFELVDTFERHGLRETISGYLGERPAISVNKGTLRRAAPTAGTEWWHQDGAFLGGGIRSLNIWLALSDCGVDAPGMDIVAKRLDGIVEKGTRGADFEWSVGDPIVAEVSGGAVARPVFAPGDALLFDHLCLHRTGTDPSMTETRYATETWFFAPSAYPDPMLQVPLAF